TSLTTRWPRSTSCPIASMATGTTPFTRGVDGSNSFTCSLTLPKGRRALEAARPLWARAQDKVLRESGTKAWADAQRRLAHLLYVAVKRRGPGRGRRRGRPRRAPRRRSRAAG